MQYIFFVFLFLSCCNETNKKLSVSQNEENLKNGFEEIKAELIIMEEKIPSTLIEFINKELNQYSIPTVNNYMDGWELFSQNDSTPFLACSDFNLDGHNDYALILERNNSDQVSLFIFNTIGTSFLPFYLADYYLRDSKIATVITVEKKGKWEGENNTIITSADGVLVKLIVESRSCAYYWDDHQYTQFLYD